MTTTRAAFGFGLLREMPAPDLLVMDEASQVSLAYALAFLPLAKAVMFAGDPEQLAPIVRVEHPSAQTWLGGSTSIYEISSPDPKALSFWRSNHA
jgi:superfamily I DNA and/or RNA helicase